MIIFPIKNIHYQKDILKLNLSIKIFQNKFQMFQQFLEKNFRKTELSDSLTKTNNGFKIIFTSMCKGKKYNGIKLYKDFL